MAVLMTSLVFSAAFGVSIYALAATVLPQWQRILSVLSGRELVRHAPLTQLVRAERRIAVRRWSTANRPVFPPQSRAAA